MNEQQLEYFANVRKEILIDLLDRLSNLPEDREKLAILLYGYLEAYSDCTSQVLAVIFNLLQQDEEEEREVLRTGLSKIGQKALKIKKEMKEMSKQ